MMDNSSNNEQKNSAASSVAAAAKTGKAIANIAKGAAHGGMYGAALAAAMSSKKWIIPVVALLLLPVILVAMLPSIIFGPPLTVDPENTEPSGIVSDEVLTQTILDMNDRISSVLSAGLDDTLARINADFITSGCDEKEINNPYGADIRFNANYLISLYCASKSDDVMSISVDDMISKLEASKGSLYSFTYSDSSRWEEVESDPEEAGEDADLEAEPPEPEYVEITTRTYTIAYSGEAYFGDEVFGVSDEQRDLAAQYAQNLSMLLQDGSYQVLSMSEFTDLGVSYEGIVFSDGETQVVYYNQMDERWKDLPYGTDDIGHYACGPTSMAIVVSSLTDEIVDPPHMAQWAYENGHWCSKSGSYHSVVPGAAEAWGLSCEPCSRDDPQKLVDALASGKLVVAIMGPGHFTRSGHFIVLRGVTSEGKILVADPYSYSRSAEEWDLSIFLDEASRYAANRSPFWIIGN